MAFYLLQLSHFASTYGSGSYTTAAYSAPTIALGPNSIPLTLPATGAGWAVLLGAVAVAIGAGLITWRLGRHAAIE